MEQIPALGFTPPKLLVLTGQQIRLNYMSTVLGQLPWQYREMLTAPSDDLSMHDKYQKCWNDAIAILRKCNQDRADDPEAYNKMIVDGLTRLQKGAVPAHELMRMGIELQDQKRQAEGNTFLKTRRVEATDLPRRALADADGTVLRSL